jgi:Zn-dependent membrane protease YugP
MFFDPLYMLLLVVTGVIGFVASARVKTTFAKWDKVQNASGMTGAEIAREILRRSNISSVTVEQVDGFLSDHYDPTKRVLRLSSKVFSGRSVAAAGVAAHEVGHALQHARGYWPLGVRTKLAPSAALGSNISNVAIIGGMLIGSIGLVKIGVLFFSLMVLFVIITLPVEFDASARAKQLLPEMGLVSGPQNAGVASVLNAAALTYVAGAVAAVGQLLYWLWVSGLLGGRDD